MIDIIKRILVSIVAGAVILYTGSLIASQAIIVQAEYIGMNTISLISIIALAGYMLIVYGAYPIYHPMQKRILSILGLASIILGHNILLNDTSASIYVGDMMKLFGVLIVWFGATGILSSNGIIASKKREQSLEIIDA